MSPAPQHLSRGTRRNAWLRMFVLLLALLVPGAHSEAQAVPTAAVSGEGTAVEYDVLDTALRPPARGSRRSTVPLRPAPLPDTGYGYTAQHPVPVPPGRPHALCPLRSVVLRC